MTFVQVYLLVGLLFGSMTCNKVDSFTLIIKIVMSLVIMLTYPLWILAGLLVAIYSAKK